MFTYRSGVGRDHNQPEIQIEQETTLQPQIGREDNMYIAEKKNVTPSVLITKIHIIPT